MQVVVQITEEHDPIESQRRTGPRSGRFRTRRSCCRLTSDGDNERRRR